jgi:hypothetical protein
MPIYTFERPDGKRFPKRLSFGDYEDIKSGEKRLVDDDGNELSLVFDPGQVGFVLKDGVSGGWVSKANKENNYRKAHGQEMSRRQRDHVFKTRLVPNFGGKTAHSWRDVQDHARTTKGEASAATYDHLVAQES